MLPDLVGDSRSLLPLLLSLAAAGAVVMGCRGAHVELHQGERGSPERESVHEAGAKEPGPKGRPGLGPPPLLPRSTGPAGATLARVVAGHDYDEDLLLDTASCAGCHPEEAAEWKESAHRWSSLGNAFYRASFDQFVADQLEHAAQREESRGDARARASFCSGCHGPALALGGLLRNEVHATEDAAHAGITCATCHSVERATVEGNGSYELAMDPIPVPSRGADGAWEAASLEAHIGRVGKPALRSDELCASCHRVFLSEASGHPMTMTGVDEVGPWRRSAYSGRVAGGDLERLAVAEPASCVDCHMRDAGGRISHRFAGGHATLAGLLGSEAQMQAIRGQVEGALTLRLWRVDRPREGPLFQAVVYNAKVGHRFPGGARDLRQAWLEAKLVTADGRVVARAVDHRFGGVALGESGEVVGAHRVAHFRANINDHTIAPEDATVVEYELPAEGLRTVDSGSTDLLRLEVRLVQRRLTDSMTEVACAATVSPRGRQFRDATLARDGIDFDPCREQPQLEIAHDSVSYAGPSGEGLGWRAHFERGLGLSHAVLERADEALDALEVAYQLSSGAEDPSRARAQILLARARILGRQGLTAESLEAADRAEAELGSHPAISRVRGDAYARVFGSIEATRHYVDAAHADDDRIWQALAIEAGIAGEVRTAYNAARAGLRLEPRDSRLLRSQMLALRAMSKDGGWGEEAANAFTGFQPNPLVNRLRQRCFDSSPECFRERSAVHVHELIPRESWASEGSVEE